jgi:hypothetical protein
MEKKLPSDLGQIVASFVKAQPLGLMFQDEARFGRISDTCYCWAKRPIRPMVQAMLTHQYTYANGAVVRVNYPDRRVASRRNVTHTPLPTRANGRTGSQGRDRSCSPAPRRASWP